MKTFIADIIPKLQRYSQQLDNLTLLTNQHWVVVDEIANSKTVYIFRSNHELLISKNGEVEKAKWEYLGNGSLLLDLKDKSYLFRHGFFDENILALKVDGKEEYAFLVNETRFDKELSSTARILEFLNNKYIGSIENTEIYHRIESEFPELTSKIDVKPLEAVINDDIEAGEKDKFDKRVDMVVYSALVFLVIFGLIVIITQCT